MKHYILPVAVVATMLAMSSCTSSEKSETRTGAEETETQQSIVPTDITDSVAMNETADYTTVAPASDAEGQSLIDKLKASTTAAEAKELSEKAVAYAKQLMASGKVQEAKAFLSQVGPYIKEKAPEVFESVKTLTGKGVDAVKEKASEVTDATKEKASEMKDATKEKADELKEKARNIF